MVDRKAARAARKAELADMFARERAATARRERRAYIAAHGYSAQESYGVTVDRAAGTVVVGDESLGDAVTGLLAGARAALETPADARDRVTAARVAALGLLALAVPKRDRRLFLVISGPTFEGVCVVDGSDAEHLRKWVAWFNTAAAGATQDAGS